MALAIPQEVLALGGLSRFLGVPDPVGVLDDFRRLVDTDELRRIARDGWGTAGARSPNSRDLERVADSVLDEWLGTVENRWRGDAYRAFAEYLDRIRAALHEEADRYPEVGDALIAVADGIELTWLDMVGAALTVAGIVIAVPAALASTLLGLVSLLVSLACGVVTYLTVANSRVSLLARAGSALDRYDPGAGSPLDSRPSVGGTGLGWVPKTADPYA